MKFKLPGDPREFDVELTAIPGGAVQARINGDEEIVSAIESTPGGGGIVRIGRRAARIYSTRQRGSTWVSIGPAQFEFITVEPRSARRAHGLTTPEVTAPLPGKVVRLPVTEGQQVASGDVLVVLEAMKMETALHAESPAVIKQIRVTVGQTVDHGAVLVVLSPAPSPTKGAADPAAR